LPAAAHKQALFGHGRPWQALTLFRFSIFPPSLRNVDGHSLWFAAAAAAARVAFPLPVKSALTTCHTYVWFHPRTTTPVAHHHRSRLFAPSFDTQSPSGPSCGIYSPVSAAFKINFMAPDRPTETHSPLPLKIPVFVPQPQPQMQI